MPSETNSLERGMQTGFVVLVRDSSDRAHVNGIRRHGLAHDWRHVRVMGQSRGQER